ncbi:GTPase/DUF3482 domain-containing protein [Ectothiorhodospiraceae bacterium 2226]|nr:GTPase/DUF3482 domain-containing protein [Ectothiorhodospiraceae bacterium 2226]
MAQELHLVVAGHTNTGKTSLLRTLGRTAEFGAVSPSPATTRRIEPLRLIDTDQLRITVYDTPGLENSAQLHELLEQRIQGRHDRPAVVEEVVASADARFAQESLVLRQVLLSDATLYVIDAREPVLEKYLDEIAILALCGRPLLPLLNFTAQPGRADEWRARLAEIGQHNVVAFDAVVYDWASERRLYRTLRAVLPAAEAALDGLIRARSEATDWRLQAAARALAEALIDLAAAEAQAPHQDAAALDAAAGRLETYARQRERRLTVEILKAFNYSPEILGARVHEDFEYADAHGGGWRRDPLDPDTLKRYGLASLGPITGGAGAGAAIDVAAFGTLFGLPTLLGILGGAVVGARRPLRNLYRERFEGLRTLAVSEAVLRLIATRNLQLVAGLEHRGHASQAAVTPAQAGEAHAYTDKLPPALRKAMDHPRWSDFDAPAPGLARGARSLGEAARTLRGPKWKLILRILRDSDGATPEARERAVRELQTDLIAWLRESPDRPAPPRAQRIAPRLP